MSSKITINGVTYYGDNVVVNGNNQIVIDGKTFYFREEKEYIEKWGDRKMKNPLIGISAKKQSGKDEVFKIIQRLTSNEVIGSPWQNKKFAEKLKQM